MLPASIDEEMWFSDASLKSHSESVAEPGLSDLKFSFSFHVERLSRMKDC